MLSATGAVQFVGFVGILAVVQALAELIKVRNASAPGKLNKQIGVCAPQLALLLIEQIVNRPEELGILLAGAFRCLVSFRRRR